MKLVKISTIFLFAFLSVTFGELSQEKQELIIKIHKECQDDPATHLSREIMERLAKDEETEADKVISGKHGLCMNVKMGFQKQNGDVDFDKFREHIKDSIGDEKKANEMVTACTKQLGKTPEETAFVLSRCFYKKFGIESLHL